MYLDNCKTLDDVKQAYKQWAHKLHPDVPGGSEKAMKALNNEYDTTIERLNRTGAAAADNTATEMAEYKVVITALINLAGLQIELCGRWLWISGDTRRHKEVLKAAGCKWAAKKLMWYWYPAGAGTYSRHNTPIEKIRHKYGSTIVSAGSACNMAVNGIYNNQKS